MYSITMTQPPLLCFGIFDDKQELLILHFKPICFLFEALDKGRERWGRAEMFIKSIVKVNAIFPFIVVMASFIKLHPK